MNLPKTEYTKGNCIYKGRDRVGYAKPGGRMYSFAEMSEVSGMTRTGLKRRIAGRIGEDEAGEDAGNAGCY